MTALADELQERLAAANAASGSVGAVASVRLAGERADAAAGVADSRDERAVTVDTPFRLGSIAKVVTARALLDALAAAGRSVDDPVVDLLPGCVPDGAVTATWRHVLAHRSGIDGTHWAGFGDDADAVGRYAREVAALPVVFDPGDSWGYSNSGYVLAGAALEVLTGSTYDAAVAEGLLAPHGCTTTTLWAAGPPDGAANGHHLGPDGVRPADVPSGTRALAPTGAAGWTTAAELLDLADGLLADQWHALAADAAPMPPGGGTAATHQALGWRVFRWGDTTLFGHDGGATGMGSFVRWIPETGSGIALVSNTNPSAMLAWAQLSPWFLDEAGVTVPGWLERTDGARPEPELCGEYRARDATFTVGEGDGALTLEVDGLGGALRRSATLAPLAPGVYRSDQMVTDPTRIISFEQPRGAYRLLHAGPFTARA